MILDNENGKKILEETYEKYGGCIYQSPEWIKAKKASGKNPIFLAVEEEGKITAFASIFEEEKTLPAIGRKKILFLEGNPISKNEKSKDKILKEFKDISKKYFYGINRPIVLDIEDSMMKKLGYSKVSNYTVLIDLKKSKEELWNALEKKSARWGIKTAEKNNLSINLAEEKEAEEVYNLYVNTTKEGGFNPESIDFLKSLRNNKISKLLAVKNNKEEIIAAGLILIDEYNKYSILNLTTSTEKGQKLQAMPFLYWKMIEYSKDLGLNYFDLGGYDSEAKKGSKMDNINKFKERFGGKITEQPIYSTKYRYAAFRSLLKIKKKIT